MANAPPRVESKPIEIGGALTADTPPEQITEAD